MSKCASIAQLGRCWCSSRCSSAVLIYAFWPGNKKRFEQAARLPLGERSRARRRERRLSHGQQRSTTRRLESETTGHEWDGIKELNTPLPRWWLWTFYATIVWALGYWIALSGLAAGGELHHGRARLRPARGGGRGARRSRRLRKAELPAARSPASDLADDQRRSRAAELRPGRRRAAFGDNCAQCHGRGAAGASGYPNLDDDWLWGGYARRHPADHRASASAPTIPKTRDPAQMPAFGDGSRAEAQIDDVADYVLSLSGRPTTRTRPARGAKIFAENCARLPRRGRQGQPGARRAGPDRRDLALRRRQGDDRRRSRDGRAA